MRARVTPWSRMLLREGACALAALGLAALVATHLAVSERAFLVYLDGDSMLPALVRASVAAGQPQDWVLSSPLFLPETALALALGALPISVHTLLTLTGIVNWIALYAAFRFLAGAGAPSAGGARDARAPTGALAATAVLAAMALLESSPDRNALQGASLLNTGTYYSATVVGTVLVAGLVTRLWTAPRHPRVLLLAAGGVAAVSALTNPIFLVWCVVPAFVVALVLLATGTRMRVVAPGVGVLVAASALGMLGRIPFAPILLQDPSSRVVPERAGESARYYGGLVADLAAGWPGRIEIAVVLASIAVGVAVTVHGVRRGDRSATILGALSWVLPVVVTVISVDAGTLAPRCLQPVFYAPPIALIGATRILSGVPSLRRARFVPLGAAVLVAVAVAPMALVPSPSTSADQRSVACVDHWVTASGRIGAGQYWSIRAPKASLANPRQLLQTDQDLNPYVWLIDRADYRGVHRVSFVVDSPDSPPTRFEAPAGATATTIRCGRYTITDYGAPILTLGTPHS